MEDLIKDSKYIQNLLENDSLNDEEIIKQFPTINFYLLKAYYNGKQMKSDDNLLKIAEYMNYLNCGRLEEVLIKIKHKHNFKWYQSLNEDLIKEIEIELNKITQIACTYNYSVALRKDGSIISFCEDEIDILPPKINDKKYIKIACYGHYLAGLSSDCVAMYDDKIDFKDGEYTTIACGYDHVAAIRKDGTLVTWGKPRKNSITHVDCIDVKCGYSHTVVLKKDGTIAMYNEMSGDQREGMPTNGGYKEIACGSYHSVALHNDGSIVTWGSNDEYQLENCPSSTKIGEYIAIACGDYHSVALRSDGSVVTWGDTGWDQEYDSPTGNGYIAIACGQHHSVALHSNGSVTIWGSNDYDQRDNCPKDNGYIAIACGCYHSMALKNDGTVTIWGGY